MSVPDDAALHNCNAPHHKRRFRISGAKRLHTMQLICQSKIHLGGVNFGINIKQRHKLAIPQYQTCGSFKGCSKAVNTSRFQSNASRIPVPPETFKMTGTGV